MKQTPAASSSNRQSVKSIKTKSSTVQSHQLFNIERCPSTIQSSNINAKKIIVAPSILAADFSRLADEIRRVQQAGADWIHCDDMDGHFVDNLYFEPAVCNLVQRV